MAPEQVAHPADAGGVEPVGGFVEDEDLGLAQEGVCDAETLPHPERVVADAARGLVIGETDQLKHLVDAPGRQAQHLRGEGEDFASGAAGVLRGRVQQDADFGSGVRQIDEAAAQDVCGAVGGRGEAHDDAHRGGLPGAVRAQESGDAPRLGGEGDIVDGGILAVTLGD
jgi:hypothetical protein